MTAEVEVEAVAGCERNAADEARELEGERWCVERGALLLALLACLTDGRGSWNKVLPPDAHGYSVQCRFVNG